MLLSDSIMSVKKTFLKSLTNDYYFVIIINKELI